MDELKLKVQSAQCQYFQAHRCWRSNNLKHSLSICDDISSELKRSSELVPRDEHTDSSELVARINQVKQLVWFLRFKCLADDYHVNESLLLNEDDMDDDDQVRVFGNSRQRTRLVSGQANQTAGNTRLDGTRTGANIGTGAIRADTRQQTGILTGRMPSVSSRSGSRASSSYRPLTTSLTATQTAFSRGTRLLLKYAICQYIAKPMFEYLYNAQAATNVCPDYRQCLEYLNLVKNSARDSKPAQEANKIRFGEAGGLEPLSINGEDENGQLQSPFWLIAHGVCYFKLRMNKQAEDHFNLALKLNPNHLDSYAWLIKIYIRANRLTDVLRTCDSGLRHCKSAILYNWKARVQSLVQESFSANSSLRESLIFNPTNIEALANVGHFAFYSDDLEKSLKCFERIHQLSVNQTIGSDNSLTMGGGSAELLNNLALCNFYCGYYHKVVPLFLKAFLSSPTNEVTSDLWYNLSFVPMNLGLTNMAISCLKLALKSNSQNEEAMNNLGVLKYGPQVNEFFHFSNRLESASIAPQKHGLPDEGESDDENSMERHRERQMIYDEAEGYFHHGGAGELPAYSQPETLFNMAVIKKNRGHLLSSVRFCNLYMEQDANNYHINNMLKEIGDFISFDS